MIWFDAFFVMSLLAAGAMLAAYLSQSRWEKREQAWREREMALVDRLLKQAHVAPVTIERENVIKLPDPEIQPPTWQDEAFFIDDIKEELEQVYPEAAHMSHKQAMALYAKDWQAIERRLREQQTPMRVG